MTELFSSWKFKRSKRKRNVRDPSARYICRSVVLILCTICTTCTTNPAEPFERNTCDVTNFINIWTRSHCLPWGQWQSDRVVTCTAVADCLRATAPFFIPGHFLPSRPEHSCRVSVLPVAERPGAPSSIYRISVPLYCFLRFCSSLSLRPFGTVWCAHKLPPSVCL
jgi:hypothetical protein